ncbi:trypsin-like peptidase domain-containing protein [Nonomuraea jiangxiensis]|uniref:Trypsin-like peptidase domain-containing protein n=1 Tax=Nonomuraea jiangxiensis TaxID=633440 RepID=A0A1G8HK11_9ACTN|nr:trypsin-like peptidase domain-containing protein [Nonomuraea jiangxiensis]SDI07046.1 Trypsin-like peptidase domain-containing protein [Nonomuraea jiangxiensis]
MPRTLVTVLTTLAGVALATPPPTTPRPPAATTPGQPPAAPAVSATPPAHAAAGHAAAPAVSATPPAHATTGHRPQALPVTGVQPPAHAIVPGLAWGAEVSPPMRPRQAVRYWTAGKQAKARAADLPASRPASATAPRSGPAIGPRSGQGVAQRLSVPGLKRLTPGGDANGYAHVRRPYTRSVLSRTSGRLFFVNAAGTGDSCSASVIRSATRLLIVTAAHCVYGVPEDSQLGQWHTNFAFVPAYDGRATSVRQREPYGRWGGRRVWKPDGYTGLIGGDWNSVYDIALIEVGRRDDTLQEAVGALTPMRNEGGRHSIVTTGYPGLSGRKPYDGRDQLFCVGRTRPATPPAIDGTALAAHIHAPGRMETDNCHLYKGHSGGPWVIKGTNDLVGVLSAGKDDGEPDGNSVATALNFAGYGAIVRQADPDGVYDALSIRASAPSRPVRRGTTATVAAVVTMRGLMAAAHVPVTLILPRGTSLVSVTGARCLQVDRRATCTIAAVHPDQPVTISAEVHVGRAAGRRLDLAAHVWSTPLDPSQHDNASVASMATR